MNRLTVILNAGDSPYMVEIEPTDNNGTMQYVVTVLNTAEGPYQESWYAIIEKDSVVGWRQSPESIERGPKLPCFLVEEICENIEHYFK